ncbi:MAG TPA: hypothetical protein VK324_04655 [Tepidisphaeraceae bacterium]|nr:hypothetical protein [Tepidisphaeraceae bacterium]
MSDATAPPSPPPGTSPDWAAVTDRVACPPCDYELRGLVEPRCPECGYQFAWHELLDPAQRLHPYLYEHHPERGAWAFWKTVAGGLRPSAFWRSLRPTQPSSGGRLVRYWGSCAAAAFVPLAGLVTWRWFDTGGTVPWVQVLDRTIGRDATGAALLAGALFFTAWPWLTFLALNVFFQSMVRARVQSAHVVRCVVYSADVAVAFAVLAAVAVAGSAVLWPGAMASDAMRAGVVVAPLGACYLVACWRLVTAYGLYMRFERPAATVFAAQVVALLAGLTLLVYVGR